MKKSLFITQSAIIASVYTVLTFVSAMLSLSSGVVQIRLSEALTTLAVITPSAIPGLFVGCVISNILTGCTMLDVIFGSLATLIGAFGTYFLRRNKFLAPLPPILANTVIIPFILSYVYHFKGSIWFFMLTVGAGEVISCGVLGLLLLKAVENRIEKRK